MQDAAGGPGAARGARAAGRGRTPSAGRRASGGGARSARGFVESCIVPGRNNSHNPPASPGRRPGGGRGGQPPAEWWGGSGRRGRVISAGGRAQVGRAVGQVDLATAVELRQVVGRLHRQPGQQATGPAGRRRTSRGARVSPRRTARAARRPGTARSAAAACGGRAAVRSPRHRQPAHRRRAWSGALGSVVARCRSSPHPAGPGGDIVPGLAASSFAARRPCGRGIVARRRGCWPARP